MLFTILIQLWLNDLIYFFNVCYNKGCDNSLKSLQIHYKSNILHVQKIIKISLIKVLIVNVIKKIYTLLNLESYIHAMIKIFFKEKKNVVV